MQAVPVKAKDEEKKDEVSPFSKEIRLVHSDRLDLNLDSYKFLLDSNLGRLLFLMKRK